MEPLVECVPNISEGHRREVVDAVAQAIEETATVRLLDRTSDPDHDRSVFTFAGPVPGVTAAMHAAADVALRTIDLRLHRGQHPRLGAVDVVPFVPLGGSTMSDCVALARRFGAELAEAHDLPVYLYAEAASRPERRVLADIRRPQFEGLAARMAEDGWEPDFGPRSPHPSAGACVVGARPFLIAWNIDLDVSDVAVAKDIASRIRERGGGLPRVQALGLYLEASDRAQVSMNLLDHEVTPMWRVFEEIEAMAGEHGVAIADSELIGLAPLQALLAVADHAGIEPDAPDDARARGSGAWLRIRDFDPLMALELRLAAGGDASG